VARTELSGGLHIHRTGTRQVAAVSDWFLRRPGEYIAGRLRNLRSKLERRRRHRLKTSKAAAARNEGRSGGSAEYFRSRLHNRRKERDRRRRRRLKQSNSDRPLVHLLRAASGLPVRIASPADGPAPTAIRQRRDTDAQDTRPHLWIVVPSGIQYFRFVESGAFAALDGAYRTTYVFPDPESRFHIPRDPSQFHHDDILFIPIDVQRYRVWSTLFEVSCRALAARCASFRIRSAMALRSRRRKAKSRVQRLYLHLVPLLASKPVFDRLRRNLVRALGPEPTLTDALAADRPRAIVIPSSLHDCLTNDAILSGRSLGITTVVLQTSWDNISSKGIVATTPDIMGVWGEQSLRHAVDLQGMTANRCVVVGSPYYECFFNRPHRSRKDARRALGLPEDGLIVLFGGSFRQFDEAALLKRIEDAVEDGRLPNMLIFYRPHPGRELRAETNFFDHDWKHTVMDEEVAEVYRANLEGRMVSQNEFGYSLDRLADIYTAVDLTISPMSSIVLESLIFGLPVLGIGYSDGRNEWGPEKTSQMTHFEELGRVSCVKICRQPDEMLNELKAVLDLCTQPETPAIARTAARYFVDCAATGYQTAVLNLVREAITLPPAQGRP
jgi:hypothetical protein